MATKQSTAEFLLEQVSGAGVVRIRKMFGEYALYCNDKVVALLCDDRFFLKPTDAAKEFGRFEEGPPYPGSKPFLIIEEDRWEDRDFMADLIRATAATLPAPKPKKKK